MPILKKVIGQPGKYLFIIFLCLGSFCAHAQKVISIDVTESINPASAEFIENSIHTADDKKATCREELVWKKGYF